MKMLNKIVGSSIGVAAALALSASSVQAQNLVVNPGFESASGFTANGPSGVTPGAGWANNFGGGAEGQNERGEAATRLSVRQGEQQPQSDRAPIERSPCRRQNDGDRSRARRDRTGFVGCVAAREPRRC